LHGLGSAAQADDLGLPVLGDGADPRHGDTDVIDTYERHGRIVGGDTDAMIDAAYQAWRADMRAGRSTVLVADSTASVTELNTRARADLILDGTVTGTTEATLRDGTHASTGDTVITRKNDRRLHAGRGFVRNGDRWTVLAVRDDGSMTVRRAGSRRGNTVTPQPHTSPKRRFWVMQSPRFGLRASPPTPRTSSSTPRPRARTCTSR
jgi:hypothetical protein